MTEQVKHQPDISVSPAAQLLQLYLEMQVRQVGWQGEQAYLVEE